MNLPNIKNWGDWPPDVEPELKRLNEERQLSFVYVKEPFQCELYCERVCEPTTPTHAFFWGMMICDECLIRMVRRAFERGTRKPPEGITPLPAGPTGRLEE